MTPILFIHGIVGDSKQYQPAINYLREKGIDNFYQFTYDNRFGLTPIRLIATELAEFIAKNVKEDDINIVAFSQGGIIALSYLKFYKNKNVKKLFTVCTPHKGSALAKIFDLKGLIDLRPKSELLRELDAFLRENKINLYSVYNPFDLVVFPGWNARANHGKKKIVFAHSHPATFFSPATLKFIYKNL